MAKAIPHINLLCIYDEDAKAFEAALASHNQSLSYTIHSCSLSQLDSKLRFDLIVSPANSHGILDGGFDDAISRAFSPPTEYFALTRHIQSELYDLYRGFLPPGSCHLSKLPSEWREQKILKYGDGIGWGAKYIAICPTMRVPNDVRWDREVVYECIWSLLCAVDKHNRVVDGGGEGERIESMLMTPLATATGNVSAERWAEQVVLAIKHFQEAVEQPEIYGKIAWPVARRMAVKVAATHKK